MRYFDTIELPRNELEQFWNSIFVPASIKASLFGYSRLVFSVNGASPVSIAVNRFVFLSGPPGVGKTTLAKGFSNELAKLAVRIGLSTRLFHANAQSWRSELFGATAKEITKAFEMVRLATTAGLAILLIDELESLGLDRSCLLQSREPSDALSGVNALLNELDRLISNKNFLFIATSNFEKAVDSALLSRVDLQIRLPLPDHQGRIEILSDTCDSYRSTGIRLALQPEDINLIASRTDGFSARSLRKLFMRVLSTTDKPYDRVSARDFLLTVAQLRSGQRGTISWR